MILAGGCESSGKYSLLGFQPIDPDTAINGHWNFRGNDLLHFLLDQ